MIQVEIVDKEFDQVLRQVMAQTNRTAAQVCNEKAIKVIQYSIKGTPRGSVAKVRRELGQVGTATSRSRKGGKLGRRRGAKGVLLPGETVSASGRLQVPEKAAPLTLAHRIVLRNLWSKYQTKQKIKDVVADRAALDELAKKLIATRVASVGYLRAGWHAALDDAWSILRARFGDQVKADQWLERKKIWGGRLRRKILGRYKAALPAEDKPFAIVYNSATGQKDRQAHPEEEKARRIEIGLKVGFALAVLDMKQYMADKLQKAYNQITGGRR